METVQGFQLVVFFPTRIGFRNPGKLDHGVFVDESASGMFILPLCQSRSEVNVFVVLREP